MHLGLFSNETCSDLISFISRLEWSKQLHLRKDLKIDSSSERVEVISDELEYF